MHRSKVTILLDMRFEYKHHFSTIINFSNLYELESRISRDQFGVQICCSVIVKIGQKA